MHATPLLPGRRTLSAILSIIMLLCLSACSLGRSPRPSFFVLPSPAGAPSDPAARQQLTGPRIAIGPVTIPGTLDRPQLFLRSGNATQVTLEEFNLWSEPVPDGVARVLSETLSLRLAPRQGFAFPLRASLAPDWRISIDIRRLDGAPGEQAVLEAGWVLCDIQGKVLRSGRFTQAAAAGPDLNSLVAAEGSLLEAFANAIAAELPAAQK